MISNVVNTIFLLLKSGDLIISVGFISFYICIVQFLPCSIEMPILVFVSSPSVVYIPTSKSVKYYSDNDNVYQMSCVYQNKDAVFTAIQEKVVRPKDLWGLAILKMLLFHDNAFETQEMTLLIGKSYILIFFFLKCKKKSYFKVVCISFIILTFY